jgi:hypothetical protein
MLLACTSPVAPVESRCGFGNVVERAASVVEEPTNVVDVASFAELVAGLEAGVNTFRLTNTIVWERPLVYDEFPVPTFFSLSSNGGPGAHIVRGFDGPEPLLSFNRPVFLRLKGLMFEVPNWMTSAGPSLYVRKMFVSSWWDVMFEYHPHRPFVVEGGSAITFYNLSLQSNGEPALLTEMADVAFFGGNVEDHQYGGTGIDAYATVDRVGAAETPLIWQGVHQESSVVNLHNFTRVHLVPGYQVDSKINLYGVGCVE